MSKFANVVTIEVVPGRRVWPRGGERLSTCQRRSRRRPSTHAAADWPVLCPPGVVGTLLSPQIACGKFRFGRHTSFQPVCRLEVKCARFWKESKAAAVRSHF